MFCCLSPLNCICFSLLGAIYEGTSNIQLSTIAKNMKEFEPWRKLRGMECGIPKSAYWGRKTLCYGTLWNLKRRWELERPVFHPANWPKNGWLRSLLPFSEQNNLTRYKWNFYFTNLGTVLEDSYLHFALGWDQTSWREKTGNYAVSSARNRPASSLLSLRLPCYWPFLYSTA